MKTRYRGRGERTKSYTKSCRLGGVEFLESGGRGSAVNSRTILQLAVDEGFVMEEEGVSASTPPNTRDTLHDIKTF